MGELTPQERTAVEAAAAAPMLARVEAWAAVNSGSRNLDGLARVAAMIADAFVVLPGELTMRESVPQEVVDATGKVHALEHGRNLHLIVRPKAPLQLLFTGH